MIRNTFFAAAVALVGFAPAANAVSLADVTIDSAIQIDGQVEFGFNSDFNTIDFFGVDLFRTGISPLAGQIDIFGTTGVAPVTGAADPLAPPFTDISFGNSLSAVDGTVLDVAYGTDSDPDGVQFLFQQNASSFGSLSTDLTNLFVVTIFEFFGSAQVTGPGDLFDIVANPGSNLDQGAIVINAVEVSAIPLPAPLGLLAAAFVALGFLRRRSLRA